MTSTWNEADIAIIGMAGRFPGADDVGELWRNLRDGVSSVRALTDDELLAAGADPADLVRPNLVKVIAMPRGVDRFDATFFGFNPREAEVLDPQQRFLLECAWEALENAGYVGENYPGPTGVFAGVSTSTYLLYQVLANPAVVATLDPLHLELGNSGDYPTTRISHKLNLTGPSYHIQSACSTGLVAVHAACQSLLAEDCDMALAGSASINVGLLRGYLYEEGGIVSPDGCCRVFDARAQGSIVGGGVGIVVLKRLADAVADGDSIRAVIKGSAVNNDGALKVGYTAPSVEGQAKVIAEALARSGVEAADISYVEAHGTGTSLGDPIEVEALTRAFDTHGRRQFCALGSVKTNVGHLATAAGITGLIKTALALENGMIPPSLHFERPNPEIDFAASPFYVNTELRPWTRNGRPRRAGVSAFGFGGTNAHVVLEEAPELSPAQASPRPFQLLRLSAKTPVALEAATTRLAAHLRDHPGLDLADVAYTLERGRKPFGHRRALVCRDREEAVALLAEPTAQGVLTGTVERGDPGVAFLFPGLGDQHLHMAAGLYAAEPTFRAEVDRACALLERPLGVDLREVLYPAGSERPRSEGFDLRRLLGRGTEPPDEASRLLDRTLYAHPATFVVELALARLWMDWGVKPRALLGYSLGEYTAACIAGVLGLEEALWLVTERARLIEELPAGAMLAVPLSEEEVLSRLGPGLSLAAVNAAQMCVVAGSGEAVAELEGELAQVEIVSRRLRTSHAFHSRRMEPVAGRLVEHVRRLALKPPKIPYLSNVTGTWITGREATDPEYWGRHLCEPVRFSAGLNELFLEPGRCLLEVGPGQVLSTFARQHPAGGRATVVPSLGERAGGAEDQAALMRAVGRLWLSGTSVDGARFFRHERRRRVALPTYPFERQRYWIEASPGAALARPAAACELPPPEPAAAPPASLSEHPRPALRNAYVAPRDETERRVAGIWQKLLGVDEVGVHDDFFELGGHSFLTTRLAAELRELAGVDLAIRDLFEKPTVAGFAAVVAAERLRQKDLVVPTAPMPQIAPDPGSRHQPFPLTEVQQAYLFGRSDSFALGRVSTHFYTEIDVRGLDLARLTHAFRYLIDRHDMLRAVVHADGRQEILAAVPPYEIATLDLCGRSDSDAAEAIEAIRGQMSHQVRPSDCWPLFELRASLFDDDRIRLHFSFDFLIGDAWSLQVLQPELGLAYHRRESEIPPLSLSFRDYVLAIAGLEEWPAYRRALAYWTARLAGFPPAPDLPLATSPAAVERPTFVRYDGRLETREWQRLKERAARNGLTPSGVLLAAFAEILTVWSASPRFTVNLTLFNRLPLHPEVNQLVGDFTSLTLLAIDNSRPAPFAERARLAQRQLFEDLDHSAVSGVRVLREIARRQGRHAPAMMPVVFTSTLNQTPPGEILEGLGVDAKWGYAVSQTPQVWIDHQVNEDPRGLFYSWDVVEELFPSGMIADMFQAYQTLLARLLAEEAVWQDPGPVLPPERQLELFAAANATEGAVPEGLLHAPFATLAKSSPERVAVVAGDLTLTYGELAHRANALARQLRALGATPGSLVAVVMEKGWEQAVGVSAVLLSGAAYLPVDPELPRARRFYLLANGGVQIALTQPGLAQELEWPPEVRRLAVSRVVPAEEAGRPLPVVQGPRDLAYVIYTSGSTGAPKGVMIDHRGALNTVLDVNERFGVGPEDRVLALSSLSFDLSVYDVFGLLAAGGTLVLPEAGRSREPQHWAELIDRHGVTVWNTVPALMEMLADFGEVTGWRAPSLRLVLLSGDWISLRLPERIRKLAPNALVVSLGGATEASIWSILFPLGEIDSGWRSIPYGRPMRNQSFHVLDGQLAPRPVGVPGQLYIGGIGLAQGYCSDPEKTARSFLVEPRTGARLYRTGDLGRYLPDGTIELLGREDFQVKVGGFRIELGEIEAALARHPEIREALVVAPAEAQGNRRLAAYFVPEAGSSPDPAELRTFLGEHLPAYMVPADFVALEAFPLTANGKVDRQALPGPRGDRTPAESFYVAPRGPVEEMLAGFFREVLRVDEIGVHDDFFERGGNSLLAAQVTSRLRAGFGVELPLRTLFEKPTLGELARVVERQRAAGAGAAAAPPLLPRSPGSALEDLPLSFAQQRLWFLDQLEPDSPLYNIPAAVELTGRLDTAVMAAALGEVARRHETLRTTIGVAAGEPVQRVAEGASPSLPVIDLLALPERERELEASRLATAEVRRPFDLGRGPLLRTALLRLGAQRHRVLATMHHIVSDGWSMGLLVRELGALYGAFAAGRPSPLLELTVQYADFALWQRQRLSGELLESELAWWRGQLAGMPPALELPEDHPRPPRPTYRGGCETFAFPPELARGLAGLSGRQGVTLFMTLLAGFQTLLASYTGEEDLLVGSPVANRESIETEALIGFFVNTLVLRADLSGDPGFGELLRRTREVTLGAYAHQALPFEKLVAELQPERDPSRPPLVQVLFVLQNAPAGPLELPGLVLRPLEVPTGAVAFDLVLSLTETPAGLAIRAEYARDLFEATTVRRMLGHWRRLLESALADPGRRLAELETLGPEERQQLLREWPAAPGAPSAPAAIHELFAAQVERAPDAPAVLFHGAAEEALSYRELAGRAGRLALHLRRLGVGPGSVVGICAGRSPGLIASLLAVLEAGGAYLPLDPAYPVERLALMLEDAGVDLLVTEERLLPALSALPESLRRFCLDVLPDLAAGGGEEGGSPAAAVLPDDPAYVIYTSGSTGRPKGVVAVHRGLASFAEAMADAIGLAPGDRVLQFASIAFDASAVQIYPALLRGAAVVLHPDPTALSTAELMSLCTEEGVTVLDLPAALWREAVRELAAGGLRLAAPVRAFLTGGERLSRESLLQWSQAAEGFARPVRLVSSYGPTEATVTATLFELRGEVNGLAAPMGRPFPGVEILLLDARLQPVPAGVPGEVYLGGAGLACGYLGRPEATAKSFVPHPFSGAPGARLYRTGDLARRRGDGELEFLGRADQQVKIRGFRVETGEVEAVLARHPAIRESAVVALADRSDDLRLVAYLVVDPEARAEGTVTPAELRAFLKKALPDYMVPASFVLLDALPLTSGGKVDRRALPAPEGGGLDSGVEFAAPATPIEESLAEIWGDVLGAARVGRHDNFFDLGGHSLLLAKLRQKLQERFGRELSMVEMFQHATVAAMAEHLAAGGPAAIPRLPEVPERGEALRQGRERLRQRGERQARKAGERIPGAS